MKVIYIKWFDTTYQHGEVTKDSFDGLTEGETIGHYVGEGKRHITVAMDNFNDGYYRHLCHIPKVNIIKRRWLK